MTTITTAQKAPPEHEYTKPQGYAAYSVYAAVQGLEGQYLDMYDERMIRECIEKLQEMIGDKPCQAN